MKRIIFVTLILLVVLIDAIVACALISYHKQPELTADEIKQLDEQGIWKERTSAERARIIEDNDEALKERIRMISNAKEEVILSTFDFRSDDSGKLMLGALIDAADRGGDRDGIYRDRGGEKTFSQAVCKRIPETAADAICLRSKESIGKGIAVLACFISGKGAIWTKK